jgi:hypothetical protein
MMYARSSKIEKGVCGLVLIGVAVVVNGKHLRC